MSQYKGSCLSSTRSLASMVKLLTAEVAYRLVG
jgi:hypothetical protein